MSNRDVMDAERATNPVVRPTVPDSPRDVAGGDGCCDAGDRLPTTAARAGFAQPVPCRAGETGGRA